MMHVARLCCLGYENYEYLLAKDLFTNYSREARPVLQPQDTVNVTVDYALARISKLVGHYLLTKYYLSVITCITNNIVLI